MKIFRNLRKRLLAENNFKKYLLYAVGEIFLVVVGILIALSINNRNERKNDRQTEINIYKNLKNQISEDRAVLNGVTVYNQTFLEQCQYANQILSENNRSQIDTLGGIVPGLLRYSDFNGNNNIYQNLVSSGDIKYLKNDNIVNSVQQLQELYIYMNRLEENHYKAILISVPGLMNQVNLTTLTIEKPNEIYSFQFRNLLWGMMDLMKEKETVYNRIFDQMDSINKQLNEEL